MKIAFVAHGLGNGGAERVASILANSFVECEYEVLYLSVYSNHITYPLNKSVRYEYLGYDQYKKIRKYLRRSRGIQKSLKQFSPDYVISFIGKEMLWAQFSRKFKVIYSERTNPAAKPLMERMVTRLLYHEAYKVVFQTPGARDYFGKAIRDKASIIGNPMQTSMLPLWNPEQHKQRIITACRIVPEKNLQMLIRACAKVFAYHSDYTLEIFGTPRCTEDQVRLEKLAKELGIRDRVIFRGYSMSIHTEIVDSTVFALTSNFEGLSNSMLEALCIGVPTVCTDCPPGGAAMYIQNGANGFLVKVNDHEELAFRLAEIIENKELQQRLSSNATKLRDELTVERIVEEWKKQLT